MLPDGSDFLLNGNSHVIIAGPTSPTHAFKHTRRGYELKLRVLYTGSEYRISRCLSTAQEYNLKISVRVLVLSLRHSNKCTDTATRKQRPLNSSQNKHCGDEAFTNNAYNVENKQQLLLYTRRMQYV